MMDGDHHKSILGNGVAGGEGAVAGGRGLSPDPALADVVVVEVSPEIVLSRDGLRPVPSLLDLQVGTVHV